MCSTAEGYDSRISCVVDAVTQSFARVLKERLGADAGDDYEDANEVIEAIRMACKKQRQNQKKRNA